MLNKIETYLSELEHEFFLKHLEVYVEEYTYVSDTGRLTTIRFGADCYIPVSQLADIIQVMRRVKYESPCNCATGVVGLR